MNKPHTPWKALPSHIQAPFLASHGFTDENWMVKGKEPCGICGPTQEADHDWLHCLFIWATTEEGRKFLGEAKAADKAQALLTTGVKSVREMRESVVAMVQEEQGPEQAQLAHDNMIAVVSIVDLDEDDTADAFFEVSDNVSNFVDRCEACCC